MGTIILVGFYQCQQKDNSKTDVPEILKGDYLGQTTPGDTPELFAPDIISSGFNDMDIAISPDLNEIFFARSSPFDERTTGCGS